MAKIDPSETSIVGAWVKIDGRVRSDAACKRVEDLMAHYLVRLGTDASGWEPLFQDPGDQRFWKVTFSQGYLQAGGPPTLINITHETALQQYPDAMKGL